MKIDNGCHITQVRVRYSETDKMSVAYNSHYFTWFEIGRTELMRDNGFTYSEVEKSGYRFPLIEAGIKYLKPVHYDDVINIKTWFGRKPGLRLRMNYEISRDDIILATGFTEHIFTDENLQPRKPPKILLKKIFKLWVKSHNLTKAE